MAATNFEFYVVVPKEATNLLSNPSFETGTTGYTASNGSIARSTSYSRRGLASLELTPSASVTSNMSCAVAVTNAVQYTFSVDVLDVAGQAMSLRVNDSVPALIASTTWTGTGRWSRRSVTFTANANTPFRVIVQRASEASTAKIYADGWQVETGSTASTYLDGDMVGFVRGQVDYYWNGTPHASTSYRSGQTRSGGTELRIKDYARILSVQGLGIGPVQNNALPNVRGGNFYQNTVYDGRTISLNLAISGATQGEILTNRKALAAAINPKLTGSDQPMILRMREYDASNVEQGEVVDALVQYSGGLEGNWDQPTVEKAPMQFQMFGPALVSEYEVGGSLNYRTTVTNANYVAYRDNTGNWKALGAGGTAVTAIYCAARGNDGAIYYGGNFTQFNDGVTTTNANNIIKWDETSGAYTALSTGTNNNVLALAVGPDGAIYAGGPFGTAGGSAANFVAKWNGSTWGTLGSGLNSTVQALAVGPDGAIYAAGQFGTAGGSAATRIAKWNGTTWGSMGSGLNAQVNCLAVGPNGYVYAGGQFGTAGGVAVSYIAQWNGSAWSAMGAGLQANYPNVIRVGPDGKIYVGGAFTSAGSVANTAYVARWNGTGWESLGASPNNSVSSMNFDLAGNLYIGGIFSTAGGITLLDGAAMWNGNSYVSVDFNFPGTPDISVMLPLGNNRLYTGWSSGTGSGVGPGITTITNSSSAPVAPRFVLTGPGRLYQIKNVSTGKAVYCRFDYSTGETIILDTNPDNPTFTSSLRGNIKTEILPGSNLDLSLVPGANIISLVVSGTPTSDTTAGIVYRNNYIGLDGVIW